MEGNAFDYAVKARVTRPAPHFEGMAWYTNDFKKISLSDYKGKYVLLFFYPLDFTFVCPTEIKEFNNLAAKFKENSKNNQNFKQKWNFPSYRLPSNSMFSRFTFRT